MKKICIVLALTMIFTLLLPLTALAEEEGGCIVAATDDIRYTTAAETLSGYLTKITKKSFPVVREAEGEGLAITLLASSDIPDNGYVIRTGENEVTITGNGTRGIIHGVYAFLEKYCGCDWYTSTLISVPENEALTIPAGETTEYAPFFEYTDTDWVSPCDVEYSVANGLNGSPYRIIPAELGGNVSYISNFAHTLTTEFCASATYFEEYPEFYALHNGLRTPDQLCLTNEKVFEVVLGEVMMLLEQKHNPDESLQIISLTQHDNKHMCQCSECRRIDDENGSHSGTMISFVNRIAREVKAAGYDNVAIDTFAYQYTRQAPANVVPEDNVIVRLCTIECCFAHALDDDSCPENAALMADLSAWSKICNRIYVWDYTTNYANTLGIFPDFGVLQKNIQIFHENNVVGLYEEGNYYMRYSDGEFGELRSYLLSKLMQNPYIDYSSYMNEFLEAYYGAGWESIRQFIDMTIEKPVDEGDHLMIYSSMSDTLGFSDEDTEKADALWDAAEDAAESDFHKANLTRSRICWRVWKAYNGYDRSSGEQLIEDIKALGITMIHEGDTKGADGLNFYGDTVKLWGDKILFPMSIVFYGICVLLTLILAVFALKGKPRKYIYLLLPVLTGLFFEIFGWHRRAYIAWRDLNEYYLTLALIVLLFVIAGAVTGRGLKEKLIFALASGAVWFIAYEIFVTVINNVIFKNNGASLAIGAAFAFTGLYSIALLIFNFTKIAKDKKK